MIPKVVKMDVYPVAGHDSMELNLSGAHAPYFTRNVVVLAKFFFWGNRSLMPKERFPQTPFRESHKSHGYTDPKLYNKRLPNHPSYRKKKADSI